MPTTEDLVLAPVPFDHFRAAAFKKRLVGALNDGALCIMTSLDHRVGLFDGMPAEGSEAIAARCGLDERYVRERLGGDGRQRSCGVRLTRWRFWHFGGNHRRSPAACGQQRSRR